MQRQLRRERGGRPRWAALCVCVCALLSPGCSSAPRDSGAALPGSGGDACGAVTQQPGTGVALAQIAAGFERPVHLSYTPDDTARLVVLEQAGLARIGSPGRGDWVDWLDLRAKVSSEGEQGLLSLAFHPGFQQNGRLFVYYTMGAGDVVLSEFIVAGNRSTGRPDPDSERTLLRINQRFSNHFAGQLAFGADGYLYVGIGDGGSEGDPDNNSQRLDSLLGKILRLDVDSKTRPYGIPADNPFVREDDARPEIWALGLRNPWRFSFDRDTALMWIADVGSAGDQSREEVSIGRKGGNYGWRVLEGTRCFEPGCDAKSLDSIAPLWEYGKERGMSVIGGFVYRGCKLPDLRGLYLFSDYQPPDSPLWSLRFDGTTAAAGPVFLEGTGAVISSFGEDRAGELYALDHLGGRLLRLESAESAKP